MKRVNIIVFIIIGLNTTMLAQLPDDIKLMRKVQSADPDSSLLDYFPLAEGNLWQYRYRDNPGQMGWIENMISLGDTLMPDRLTYTKLLNTPYQGTGYIKYCRIDSLYNIREYVDTLCNEFYDPDTLGFWDPPVFHGCINDTSVNVFKLNVPDSTYWLTYFNIGGNLFWPSLRYIGEYETEIFGMETNAKVFTQYFRQYYPRDSIWEEYYGWDYVFIKGIGIYSTGFGESTTATLQGAIINGVKYGTVVGIDEEEKFNPQSFTLYQNYPNPFNSQTTITFSLDKPQQIKLEIFNVLGQRVTTLENNYLDSGIHTRLFISDKLSTGIYFIHLSSGSQIAVKKIIQLK
jgi:hypothetical protein